jgi:iron complex transport system substrate-binding protein
MNFKRLTAFILTLCMMFSLAACGSSNAAGTQETAEPAAEETEAPVAAEETASTDNGDGTRTIIDQVGNEVVLPEKIERVVIASVWPLASVYILAMGTDKLVGLDPAIISAAENSMLIKIAPEISEIESGFSVGGYMNAEELLKLDPDVVLYSSGVPEDYDVATQAGIPAVGFSLSIKDYNAVETINSWIELLGEVMGEDLGSEEYIQYGNDMQALVAERLADVQDEDKPRCMFIHKYADNTLNVPGTGTWADYWITASGGINVASELEGTKAVNIEQVYEWNPDKIFITNFNDAIPDDIYNNTLCEADWSGIEAVKNQDVTKLPLGMYRWYVTCSDSPLMLLWMAMQNQPQLFEDIDFSQTMKDFYKQFYNFDLTDEDIEYIFSPIREAAGGIK